MSGTVCCYKGCVKSYSTDKDVSFFKFPDDQKRRKKWMDNCGMPELHTLNERQLRLKRVCADHFASNSFLCPVTRNQLTEKAVPYSQKEYEAAVKAAEEAQKEQVQNPKRGRGRPPKSFSLVLVKKEPVARKEPSLVAEEEAHNDAEGEIQQQHQQAEEEEEEEEQEIEEEEDEEEEEEDDDDDLNENGDDAEYNPPPNLRRLSTEPKIKKIKTPKVKKPPKLVAVGRKPKSKMVDGGGKQKYVSSLLPAKSKYGDGDNRKSGGRRMADLSVIEDVVREMSMGVDRSKKMKMKRRSLNSDERILSKRMKSSSFNEEDINSEDEITDIDDSDEEEQGLLRANREFEMFQSGLRKIIKLPQSWGMGSVVWDPLNKMKVIPITAPELQPNGTICLFKAIQVYENSTVKVAIDGVDMTINFGIETIEVQEDVNKIIKAVAESRVCTGVENFLPDDIIYLPDARKRGYKYYADACPVILVGDQNNMEGSSVCNPCIALQKAVIDRKEKEKEEIATRKLRAIPKNLKNDFGRALYGLLGEILDDSNALKSENKEEREAVLSKYSTELGVVNGEIQKPEKVPHPQVSVDEVSASFQDIVTRLGFSLNKKAGPDGLPIPQPQIPKPIIAPKVDDSTRSQMFANKPFLNRYNKPSVKTNTFNNNQRTTATIVSSSSSTSMSGSSTSFCLGDGQTYEILGEVGSSEMVQGAKGEAIEIIEVDDETMAKLTAQNPGMIFHNAGPGSTLALDSKF